MTNGDKPLKMDQKSRLKRARQQGFDTKKVWYHGTDGDVSEIKPNLYVARDPIISEVYARRNEYEDQKPEGYVGPNIMPVYLRKGAAIQTNALAGYYMVRDPSDVRSVNAEFHPDHEGKPGLLKAKGGAASGPVDTDHPSFRSWFGKSHVRDEHGSPVTLYHGTDEDFSSFDPKRTGSTDHGWYGEGHYFTASPELASSYSGYKTITKRREDEVHPGQNVMPVHVRLENPYYWPQDRAAATSREEAREITKELRAKGHDGVIAPNQYEEGPQGRFWEVVAFEPHQVKSAIGNNGSFNSADPDITKADGGAVDPEEQQGLTAYHGSPHDFDAFDISKIGTGEGVQAYGHGLYFADAEPLAKGYRDKLSAGTYKTDDGELFKPQDRDTGLQHLNVRVAAGKSLDSAADRAFGLLQDPGQSQNKDMLTQDLDRIMSMQERGAKPHAGHMYEVHIDAHPDHHMIDWDAPLSQQPASVRENLLSVAHPDFLSDPRQMKRIADGTLPGSAIYHAPLPVGSREPHLASQAWSNVGLRGVRYFDGFSRGSGEGSRNYVVFDDKHVKIRRKYEHGGRISRATGGAVETEAELTEEEKLAAEQKKLDDTKKADEARLQQENLARMYANPQGGSDSGPNGAPLGGVSPSPSPRSGAFGLDTATMPGNAVNVGGYAPVGNGYTPSGRVSSPGSRSIGAPAPATTPNTFGAIPQSAYDLQNSPYGALPQNAFAPQSPFGALSNPFGMQAQASTPLSTRSVPSVAVQPGLPEVQMGAPVASTVFGGLPQSAYDMQNSPYGALSNPGFPSQATSPYGALSNQGFPSQPSPYGALSNAFDVGPMDFGMGKSLAGTPPQADMMGMSGVTPSNPYGGLSGFSPGSRSNPNPGGIDLSPNTTGQPSAFSGQIGQSVGPSTNAFSGARSSASPDLSPDTIGQPGSFSGQIGQSIGPATGSFSKDVAAPGFSDPLTGFSPEGFSANLGPPGTAGIASGYGAFAKGMADLGKETPPTRDELGATAAVPAGAPTPGSAFGDKTSNPGRNYGSPVSSREVLDPVNGVVPPSQSITTQTPESLPGNISPSYANPLGGIMDQMGGAFASPMSMSSISDINADPVSGMGAFGGVSDQMGSPAGPGGMTGAEGLGGTSDQAGSPAGPGGMGGVGGYGGDGSADQSGPGGPSGMGGFGGYGGDGSSDQSGPGGLGGLGGGFGGMGGGRGDPVDGMGGDTGPSGGPVDNGGDNDSDSDGGDNDAGGAAAGPSDPGGPAGDGDGPGGGEAMAKRGGRIKTKRKKIAYSTRAASNPVVMRALMLTSRKA